MNPWEHIGRARKVLRILSVIPAGETPDEVARTADWLAGLAQSDREALAAHAGALPPSQETWNEVVSLQRAREPSSKAPGPRASWRPIALRGGRS